MDMKRSRIFIFSRFNLHLRNTNYVKNTDFHSCIQEETLEVSCNSRVVINDYIIGYRYIVV